MGASVQGGVKPMGQSQLASAYAAGNTSTNVPDPNLLMQGGPGVGGGFSQPMGGLGQRIGGFGGGFGQPMGGFEQPLRNDMSTVRQQNQPQNADAMRAEMMSQRAMPGSRFITAPSNSAEMTQFGGATPYNSGTPSYSMGGVQQQNYQGGGDVFSNAAAGLNQAMQGTQQGMSYQPMNINAGQIAGQTMQYMNPYENQVVGQTLSDLDRARQMSQNDIAAQAQRAGAFGGSRQALMASELDRNFMNQAASTAGQLRQAGWTQGQNLASAAAQANQQAGLTGASLRMNAANQMGSLANLGFGMGKQTQEMQQQSGTIAQVINQALIDAAKGQFGGYTGAPAQSLDYMARALGATPNVSTTTNSRNPGLFDYLTLGATAFGGK